jgi:Beta-propeller repeat
MRLHLPSNRAVRVALSALVLLPSSIAVLSVKARWPVPRSRASTLPAEPRVGNRLPLAFEPNNGPSGELRFLARTPRYTIFLEPSRAIVAFRATPSHRTAEKAGPAGRRATARAVSLCLLGSDHASKPSSEEPLLAQTNYFIGGDPRKWRRRVPLFGKVRYASVYRKVDLIYYGNHQDLEYDFVIEPGGEPQSIRFSVEGASRAELGANGDLVFEAQGSEFVLRRPIAYQSVNSQRLPVAATFQPLGGGRFGIRVASYDRDLPLVIDPVLAYSTYLGGSDDEGIFGIRFDKEGNIYVAGETSSLDFPAKDAFQNAVGGNYDAFVSKFDPAGAKLIYSTYLGGSLYDHAVGLQLDESGSAYISGITFSPDFPTKNAWQSLPGGGADGFLAKLGPSGAELVFSTYLGGSGFDAVSALAVDDDHNIYVAGFTNSQNFPVTPGGLQRSCDGGAHPGFCTGDAFVTKFAASGHRLVYSTYLGGSNFDEAAGLAVDEQGRAYVAGQTSSGDFPTRNPYQGLLRGPANAFVTELNAAGSEAIFSTFLGGNRFDSATDVALDEEQHVYVTGVTGSTNFPVLHAFQSNNRGGPADGFLSKLDAQSSQLIYSTYIGGSGWDYAFRVAVNGEEEASVVGFTTSTDFPTEEALSATYGGGATDAFVVTLAAGGDRLAFSTYLGGSGDEYGYAITVGRGNTLWVGGSTSSKDFPTVGAFQPAYGGGPFDAFLSRIDIQKDRSEGDSQP